MSARKGGRGRGIVKKDVENLRQIIDLVRTLPATTPLEIGVLEEIRDRLAAHAKNAAIVRVRMMNAGTPPRERQRRAARPVRKPLYIPSSGTEWSESDLSRLQMLYRENVKMADISEQLGRTVGAIQEKVYKLGLKRTRPTATPSTPLGIWSDATVRGGPETPLQRAKRVVDERRRREAVARRDGVVAA